MIIGYVARHDQQDSNDDEGAITYALTQLGHKVERLRESRGQVAHKLECDFVLFHHWDDVASIKSIKVPKIFWYFDLVKTSDRFLHKRIAAREESMKRVTEVSDLGFLSDGDWVDRDKTGKLVWMTQGADERTLSNMGPDPLIESLAPILFTGSLIGERRISHINQLRLRYGDQLNIIGQTIKLHGPKLAYVLANTKIAISPDGPTTDKYWSNRIYLTLGLGGFLLHPYCERLREQYTSEELVCYKTREELCDLIDYYLKNPEEAQKMRNAGHQKTIQSHLYRHRCEQLVKTVQERLF